MKMGAEPKQLLLTAEHNALNGVKKLAAAPSARKTSKPKVQRSCVSGELQQVCYS